MGDDSMPGRQIRTKVVKRRAVCKVFAIAGQAAKAHAPGRTGKAAAGQRHVASHQLVVVDQPIAQQHPQAFLYCPQIGGLSDKDRVIDQKKHWEKMAGAAAKELNWFLILAQLQVCANDLPGHYFAIAYGQLRTGRSQLLAFGHCQHHIVNPAQTGDNEVIQTHGFPPQQDPYMLTEESRSHKPFFVQSELSHRVSQSKSKRGGEAFRVVLKLARLKLYAQTSSPDDLNLVKERS